MTSFKTAQQISTIQDKLVAKQFCKTAIQQVNTILDRRTLKSSKVALELELKDLIKLNSQLSK